MTWVGRLRLKSDKRLCHAKKPENQDSPNEALKHQKNGFELSSIDVTFDGILNRRIEQKETKATKKRSEEAEEEAETAEEEAVEDTISWIMRPSVQPKLIGQQSLLTLLSLFLRDLRYLLFKLFSAKFPSFWN